MPAAAGAQERGWWGPRPPVREQANRDFREPLSNRDQTPRLPSDASERDAAVMFAEAHADIDAARFTMAQRRLELLVARHPQSALVDVARRDLQKLYALSAPPAVATRLPDARPPEVVTPAPSDSGRSSEQPRPADILRPAALPTTATVTPGAGPARPVPSSTSAVRLANEDFRQQAGDRVFFADGSVDLGARARAALEAQADWLMRHPDVKVTVEGHADDQGSRDFNRQMAERRAETVRLRLTDLGVPAERIQATALGRNEPVADCPEQVCKTQNRRVVTVVVQVPSSLGFDAPARRTLGNAAGAVGQPPRAP